MDDSARAYVGCSDGGCVFGHPGGQRTNGGCKCLRDLPLGRRREVQRALRLVNAYEAAVAAQTTIREALAAAEAVMVYALGELKVSPEEATAVKLVREARAILRHSERPGAADERGKL